MDRSRELVPGSSSLVRERVLTTEFYVEEWYHDYLSVCRRTELTRRGVKVKKV